MKMAVCNNINNLFKTVDGININEKKTNPRVICTVSKEP